MAMLAKRSMLDDHPRGGFFREPFLGANAAEVGATGVLVTEDFERMNEEVGEAFRSFVDEGRDNNFLRYLVGNQSARDAADFDNDKIKKYFVHLMKEGGHTVSAQPVAVASALRSLEERIQKDGFAGVKFLVRDEGNDALWPYRDITPNNLERYDTIPPELLTRVKNLCHNAKYHGKKKGKKKAPRRPDREESPQTAKVPSHDDFQSMPRKETSTGEVVRESVKSRSTHIDRAEASQVGQQLQPAKVRSNAIFPEQPRSRVLVTDPHRQDPPQGNRRRPFTTTPRTFRNMNEYRTFIKTVFVLRYYKEVEPKLMRLEEKIGTENKDDYAIVFCTMFISDPEDEEMKKTVRDRDYCLRLVHDLVTAWQEYGFCDAMGIAIRREFGPEKFARIFLTCLSLKRADVLMRDKSWYSRLHRLPDSERLNESLRNELLEDRRFFAIATDLEDDFQEQCRCVERMPDAYTGEAPLSELFLYLYYRPNDIIGLRSYYPQVGELLKPVPPALNL